ncbi:AMP-binding protein [Clostridium botulinum D/C]|uniref:AMP-binding protein n=1 Tax=Clostridium botulinum TaxID=1491 RepID=UPI001E4485B4|nr:AMP-binding protein [Clostridium botulinum]MCD3350644.1 AMP-binding protein [Clostridium botulinum D/C]MCD3359664.1 AMP-binding protein [Clostridium botulinum D/C]MCD3363430.1 AMP-binding protein [Clostridium botulinum D/C]MCD3365361.1 AMP-binding protein [Clostridium botulinum D/C]
MIDIVGNRTIRDIWNEAVKFYPECRFIEFISVEDKVSCYTYKEFDKLVHKTANLFIKSGIDKGNLVAINLHNSPEYLVCWLALAQIGAVAVPINEYYQYRETKYVVDKCKINFVIAENSPKNNSIDTYLKNKDTLKVDNIFLISGTSDDSDVINMEKEIESQPYELLENRPIETQDMAVILFTSGTTENPKGAIYTNYNVTYGGIFHATQMVMRHGDKFLTSMPCYHMDFQQMSTMPVIYTGSTIIVIEHFSARRFWKQIVEHEANFTDTMSIMNRTMMLQPVHDWEKNHKMQQIYFSMGLSEEEKETFENRFNVKLLNSYGMTETVTAVTCAPTNGDKNWPSVGRPALSYKVKIINCEGNEVPDGTMGEICIWGIPGKTIISGYYNDELNTKKLIDDEGWIHTGDRGYIDDEGWLFFVDRIGNIIKRSGENVSPLEIECVITSNTSVADCAVIGIPDEIRDAAVKAFIQLGDDSKLTEDEIEKYCADRLAKFKVPTVWEFVKEFPRTSTGKIKKNLLK